MTKPISLLISMLFMSALNVGCIVVESPDGPGYDDESGEGDDGWDDSGDTGGGDTGGGDSGGGDSGGGDNGGGDNGGGDNGGGDNGGGGGDDSDRDGDGIPNIADNCPDVANQDQDIRACTDVGATCTENTDCDNNTCLKEVDDEGNWTDFGYCTIPCEDFSDCPTFWDCLEVGNAVGTYCIQD